MIVLLHSPFTGSLVWSGVAACLEAFGQRTVVPQFASAFEDTSVTPDDLAAAAAMAIMEAGAQQAVIAVHSGAGSLVLPLLELAGARVRTVIYVDALLPHPGKSWLSTLPAPLQARLVALSEDNRLPTWDRWFPADVLIAMLPNNAYSGDVGPAFRPKPGHGSGVCRAMRAWRG